MREYQFCNKTLHSNDEAIEAMVMDRNLFSISRLVRAIFWLALGSLDLNMVFWTYMCQGINLLMHLYWNQLSGNMRVVGWFFTDKSSKRLLVAGNAHQINYTTYLMLVPPA